MSTCKLWAAGSNARGQLASGDDEDSHSFRLARFSVDEKEQETVPGAMVSKVACGANHSLVLVAKNGSKPALWGVGDGSMGQLGPGLSSSTVFRPIQLGETNLIDDIISIQAAWETSFVVQRGSKVDQILVFGSNDFGLHGTGDVTHSSSSLSHHVGIVALSHLFSHKVPTLRVVHLATGPRNAFAVLEYDTPVGLMQMLVGWGAARHGQLEIHNHNTSSRRGPRQVALPLRITTWTRPTSVVDISVGSQHAIVLTSDGELLQLGSDGKSQLPGTMDFSSIIRIGCTWNNTFVQRGVSASEVIITSYGKSAHGQAGRGEDKETAGHVYLPPFLEIRQLVCGSEHVLVRAQRETSGITELWGWGWNEHGNLGLGHTEDTLTPTLLKSPCMTEDQCGKTEDASCTCWQGVGAVWAGYGTSWISANG
ncbi:SubName: Full=Uncharacterized protein {ECO:0000313/EMBL:CCA78072.1} [Serendipita indica DSM 11827]|nr:SubName: Full=Uncharacterized protein {ECO:0000313/EMBL:CCA78072.1} [Serendipita indica DSM 11827]